MISRRHTQMTHSLYIVKKKSLFEMVLVWRQKSGHLEASNTLQGQEQELLLLTLTLDQPDGCRLTSCVKHPLMFPSSSWKRPPQRSSTMAAERVNACTNCRERRLPSYSSTLQSRSAASVSAAFIWASCGCFGTSCLMKVM